MDWPKISLAHQSIQGYRKFVANTGFAEENQVTKSRPNEILQPLLRLIKLSVRRCGATNYTILMSSQSSVHFMRKMSVLHTVYMLTLMRYSLTGLLLVSSGGAQESFTVREEKLITSGLPGVLGTSETSELKQET